MTSLSLLAGRTVHFEYVVVVVVVVFKNHFYSYTINNNIKDDINKINCFLITF